VSAGYVLAFDFGLRHIGVAVGQTVTGTASPLTTLAARSGTPDWDAVTTLVREWRPQALLVGLPLNMDDTESAMSARARRFAGRLQATSGIRVHLVDERLTSLAVKDLGPDRAHAAAAVLIAEGWLASQRGGS
jgi:putative Holliday junction resolvase